MTERKGRVTIGDDGHIIGTGGNVNANEYVVEDGNGDVIGTTFTDEVNDAYMQRRKLIYLKIWWFFLF